MILRGTLRDLDRVVGRFLRMKQKLPQNVEQV